MVKIFPPHVKQGEPIVLSKSQYDEYMKAAENDVRDLVFAIIALEADLRGVSLSSSTRLT